MRSGTEVLFGPARCISKGGRRMNGPIRIAKHLARQQHQVSFSVGDDGVGLVRFSDHADGCGRDAGLLANSRGKRHLVARTHRNPRAGYIAARGDIDQVHSVLAEQPRQLHRLVGIPAAFRPVGCGNAHEYRQILRPLGTNGVHNLQRQPGPILKASTVRIFAMIRERRKELVN